MAEKLYTVRELRRGMFGFKAERPLAPPGKVLVLIGGGAPIVLWPGDRPTPGESTWNRYTTVYEIEMGVRPLSFTASLPTQEPDVYFQVNCSANYKIADPLRVINDGLDAPEKFLKDILVASFSDVTPEFEVEEKQKAETAVRAVMVKKQFSEKLPFELIGVNVSLALDAATTEYLQRRREQREAAKLAAESKAVAEAQGKLQELVQEQAEILTRRKEQHQIDNQLARIQKLYQPMIEKGWWGVIIQQLAQNPDDIGRVSSMILELYSREAAANNAILKTLIKEDIVDETHLKDVRAKLVGGLLRDLASGPLKVTAEEPKQLPPAQDTTAAPGDGSATNKEGETA
jgi:hypothetical protein